jgi:hypothetical protein
VQQAKKEGENELEAMRNKHTREKKDWEEQVEKEKKKVRDLED